jgi:CheY-like chemotaxis protein
MEENMSQLNIKKFRLALLVEDNPSDALLATTLLQNLGFIVISANDGFAALELLEQDMFDIAIVDLNMPMMSGIDLIKRIRAREQTRGLPVIVLSGKTNIKDVKLALESGTNDYIVKPVVIKQLEEKIKKLQLKEEERWYSYQIDKSTTQAQMLVSQKTKLISINEIGCVFISNSLFSVGQTARINSELLLQNGISEGNVRIVSCEQHGFEYVSHGLFLGLTEVQKKQIRLMCQELWVENKRKEQQAA